jgi:hypothetical protein
MGPGPTMPAVNELMFVLIWVLTWTMVYSLPALLVHALMRRFWMACAVITILAFLCGYVVAMYSQSMYPNVEFPLHFGVFALISSLSGLATALLAGIPVELYRRRWFATIWSPSARPHM